MKYTIVPNKDSGVCFEDLQVGEWFITGLNNLYMKIYDILNDNTVEGVYNIISPNGALSFKSKDEKVKKCKVELHIYETLGEENEKVLTAIQLFNIGDIFLIENDYFIVTDFKSKENKVYSVNLRTGALSVYSFNTYVIRIPIDKIELCASSVF
jgi:hypothetical protein